jgi:hypothetical protein
MLPNGEGQEGTLRIGVKAKGNALHNSKILMACLVMRYINQAAYLSSSN